LTLFSGTFNFPNVFLKTQEAVPIILMFNKP
jgi:hypothetical protein